MKSYHLDSNQYSDSNLPLKVFQLYIDKKSIHNIRQNKPSLIADDLEYYGVPRWATHAILLAHGVYKWLAVRRSLIKLKNQWKKELIELYRRASQMRKGTPEHREIVGRIKALEKCRAEVRKLCHSDRWQAPDFDREANEFLKSMEERYGR